MSEYRAVKEFRPIIGKVMYAVEKKGWFLWGHVKFTHSKNDADNLIKYLQSEGL